MPKIRYQELFSLDGKGAIVTGGAGFLGERFCTGLAQFGANVACVDVQRKAAETLARRIASEYPVKALGIECDISKPAQVHRMVRQVKRSFGSIDILHNNAAYYTTERKRFYERFEDYSLKTWREVMSVNIDGMFLVAQAVGREMIEQDRGGSIVQTASVYGALAPNHQIYRTEGIAAPAVYAASKGAVIQLTRYLSAYWAKSRIRVNTLSPGGVERGQKKSFMKHYSERVPMNRMAKPDELVSALVYLASDASSYVTGQNLMIDGGLSAW